MSLNLYRFYRKNEALEFREPSMDYFGKGELKAISYINECVGTSVLNIIAYSAR